MPHGEFKVLHTAYEFSYPSSIAGLFEPEQYEINDEIELRLGAAVRAKAVCKGLIAGSINPALVEVTKQG